MGGLETLILAAVVISAVLLFRSIRRKRVRKELLSTPLPDSIREYLKKKFPRYTVIPEEYRENFEGIVNVLVAEKRFEACGGMHELNLEEKTLISAQAALMIMALPGHKFYPRLKSILVYPGAFRDRGRRKFGISEEESRHAHLGESWSTGSVILSWESVSAGAFNDDDGMNVTVHEFAHQLDQVNGAADGIPILKSQKAYRRWVEVFYRHYEELVEAVESGKGSRAFLDPYGATNPAEFFAVASETFFEEPRELREEHPELYGELSSYYHLDPASWDEV